MRAHGSSHVPRRGVIIADRQARLAPAGDAPYRSTDFVALRQPPLLRPSTSTLSTARPVVGIDRPVVALTRRPSTPRQSVASTPRSALATVRIARVPPAVPCSLRIAARLSSPHAASVRPAAAAAPAPAAAGRGAARAGLPSSVPWRPPGLQRRRSRPPCDSPDDAIRAPMPSLMCRCAGADSDRCEIGVYTRSTIASFRDRSDPLKAGVELQALPFQPPVQTAAEVPVVWPVSRWRRASSPEKNK